jgi:YD repeat-containing protein
MNAPLVMKKALPLLFLLLCFTGGLAPAQVNSTATRTNNPDGSTTVTTTTTYRDGSTTTTTTYDKDGHDAGTTRTDVQTKDGETTTTTTKYDGAAHETGKTIERVDKDGNKTTTTYDGQGHETGKTVEKLNADGSKTVTTYDGQGHETGKETVPKKAPTSMQASIEGFVVPDEVHDRQPFTFAVPEGAGQINIQTLDGVVVDKRPPDKFGRVFLQAGLAAGQYLISRSGGDAKEIGKIEIRPRSSDVLQHTWENPPQEVRIVNPPQSVRIGDPLWLSGHGFSPNCADMQANLLASGQTHSVTVLAATEDQLKLAPLTQVKPGAAELKIINQATHQGAPSQPLLFYDLEGRLQQNKLRSGQETSVVFEAQPANVNMKLHATISGKATFSGGRTELDAVIEHGRLSVPVDANKGSGDFHIDFEGEPQDQPHYAGCSCGCGGSTQPACAHKGCSCANTSAVSTLSSGNSQSATCSCGCGGTAQPACAHKGCSCSKAAIANAVERASCSCGCGGTAQPACAHKGCVCSKAAAAYDRGAVSLQPRLENVSATPARTTGKAGCSCGCGGTAQPRCAHKACGCSK